LRDMASGKIIRTEVPGLDDTSGSKNFVICDDICDGGRTFIEIAKAIQYNRPKEIFNDKIYLCVTHGIFSAGFEELEKYFKAILTTNSVKEDSFYTQSESVKLFNVF